MIDLFQPQVGDAELAAVADVFNSKWLGHGRRAEAFESEFADHIGVPAGTMLFLGSATAGIFLAMEALELREGDEVILPSPSFVAVANAIASCGARPVFCDVDPATQNPGVEDVRRATTPRTRAVVMLHYGGCPGDIVGIADHCRTAGLTLIEDCAVSPASRVDGRAVGSFGDFAVWSFHATKVMTTGDGGMLRVGDPELATRVRRLAYHGLAQPTQLGFARVSSRWWEMDVPEIGRREIGNDLTAAIGRVQLRRMPAFVARRGEVVAGYDRELGGVEGLTLPPPLPAGHESSYSYYWVRMDPAIREAVAGELLAAGIYTSFRYAPLHRLPAYRSEGLVLPGVDRAAEETLCLPLHPGLSDADVVTVATALRKAVASRSAASAASTRS
ncbi:DegT/DnrJ/EryC1/StrS family aminotransferase [Streptomyces sp. NPDC000410]|uniref:DegT/DnrJ/EryC1/StrS family aminotransferase n=1 Tax=Streptomyces sp. NPDC000410 TaxID=3154254 RepID=UPI00331DDCBC